MIQNAIVPIERIERKIYFIRGQKVILDFDLARLYEVETKVLLQAVKRNIGRFPDDFVFQVTEFEFQGLRSQFVTSKGGGGRSVAIFTPSVCFSPPPVSEAQTHTTLSINQ
jgi:hypothetical protein